MTVEETISEEKEMFEVMQFALNTFWATAKLSPEGSENKPAKIKNLRIETVQSPSQKDKDWIVVLSYQEQADNLDTQADDDFMAKIQKNKRYYKKITLGSNPLRVKTITDNVS